MNLKRLLYALVLPLLLLCGQTYAQDKTVTGRVTDATGAAVSNATVIVKGTTIGTSTNADGAFTLRVPASATTLSISSVGFSSQEVPVTSGILSVKLTTSSAALNEVVVVGYGTQRKREVTGAIVKITSEKINALPTPSFEAALQGRAAGVQVVQGSGLAGSGSVVRIRGINSISASGDPLYVVDGVPITQDPFIRGNSGAMNQNPLAAINPNDIESIEVLKDAAAAGIYGSRGANGVILITTKRGKSGKPAFNYSNRIGFATYANKPSFVNSEEWLALRQEAWQNDGNSGLAPLPGGVTWAQARNTNTDWWDLLTRTGVINEHNISMNMGTDKAKLFLSGNFGDQQSYIVGNSFTRYGVRANFDYKFSNIIKAGITTGWNRGVNNRVPAAWAGGLGDAMSYALPIYPVYKNDGSYWLDGANPVARINENIWKNTDDRFLGSVYLEVTPIKNLTLRAVTSLDYLVGMEDQFESARIRNQASGLGYARRSPNTTTNNTSTFTANYIYNLNENNAFTFLLGSEVQESKSESYNNSIGRERSDPWYEDKDAYKLFRDTLVNTNQIRKTEFNAYTFNSFFGRINYSWKNKLFLQALARVDGSSKFGSNNKYGFFPSGAIGYVLSEEEFVKNIPAINFLKARASFGLMGNAGFPAGNYYAAYFNGANYGGSPTTYYTRPGNPDLHWEAIQNFDAGLEFGLFKNRISGELAYYNRTTTDILLNAGVSPSTGFSEAFRNLSDAKIVNQGVELSLNTTVIQTRDVKWTIGGNIAKNYNEVKSLGGLSADAIGGGTNDTRIAVGYPVGTNYLVRFYGVDPTDGLPIWLDLSGKQTKTFSLNNRMPVGSVIPDYVGGFNTNVTWKGFDLGALFTYTIGGNIYDGSGKRQLGIVTDWNIRSDIADRWRKPGDIAKYPRLTMNTNQYDGLSSEWQYNSTMFLHDASFLRLRELTLGYKLNNATASRLKLKGARIFVTGMNLLTFTKYPGGDPEIARDFENAQDRNLSPNITYLTAPQQKSVTFGLNINF